MKSLTREENLPASSVRDAEGLMSQGGLGAAFSPISEADAITLANEQFGLNALGVVRFATEKDDTFKVKLSDGQLVVLKIANPFEDEAEIDFQTSLLQHIAKAAPRIPIPRILRSVSGRRYERITDAAGQSRLARAMSYLDGTPLDGIDSSAVEREQVGETLANLRLSMADFRHRAESRTLAWDVRHLLRLAPLVGEVRDPRHKSLLTTGVRRFAEIEPDIRRLRTQVLHNDFSRSNIVVDRSSPNFVCGVIDFGDAVRTAVAVDVSTALLNQLPRDLAVRPVDDIFMDGRDLLRGYLRVADLSQDELALIPYLTMGRVIVRALLSLRRTQLFPENKLYLMRNTEQGWAQLEWFLSKSSADLSTWFFTSGASSMATPTASLGKML